MKSRLVILSMLVLGMLLSTAGAGLAVSGFSDSGNAAEAQYGTPTPTPTATGNVLGDQDQSQGGQDVLARGGPGRPGSDRSGTRAALAPGRGGRGQLAAAVHRLRRDPDPARRHRAADRRPRAAAPDRRRALALRHRHAD